MADAIAKAVLPSFLNTWKRESGIFDKMTDLTQYNPQKGDTIDIPEIAPPDSVATPTTRGEAQTLAPTVSTLTINQEEFNNIRLTPNQAAMWLQGKFPPQLALSMRAYHMNKIDDNILDYLLYTLSCGYTACSGAATYVENVAGDAPTDDDINLCEAKICAPDSSEKTGAQRQNLAWFVNSYGLGAFKSMTDYIATRQSADDKSALGINAVTHLNGIPVYMVNSGLVPKTAACTAVVIATNVATVTAADHGFVVGEKVTIAGITTELTTAAAITSVADADTFTVPLQDSDGAMADGAGTVTSAANPALLVDTGRIWTARSILPDIRTVPDYESPMTALQFYSFYGRVGRAGACRVLMTPANNVA